MARYLLASIDSASGPDAKPTVPLYADLRKSNEDAHSIIPKTLTRPVDTTQGCDYDNASWYGAGVAYIFVVFQ